MTTQIIKEGVLNDDTLYTADDGKVFKGGYVAVLEYYTFQTHWTNTRHYKHFRTLENAEKFIAKQYGGVTV